MKKTSKKRSAALVTAQQKYRSNLKKKGVKRKKSLPGSEIPEDVLKALESIQQEEGLPSLSAAIWYCIRGYMQKGSKTAKKG